MIARMQVLTAVLLVMAGTEPGSPPGAADVVVDAQYRTACGPIACYVAIRRVGGEATLSEMVAACGGQEGETTSFATLAGALSRNRSINVRAVRMAPDQLFEWLESGDRAVILPVREGVGGRDHAVCAVGVENNRLVLIDYPELRIELARPLLEEIWNGEAILVTRSRIALWCAMLLGGGPGLVCGLALVWLVRFPQRRIAVTDSTSRSEPAAPCPPARGPADRAI